MMDRKQRAELDRYITREEPGLDSELPNARFWVMVNDGWVKLTLHPEQILTWRSGSPTDEGYSNLTESYQHDGATVTATWYRETWDAGGRYTSGGSLVCAVRDLHAATVDTPYDPGEFKPPGIPKWMPMERWQRDHSAEAAGY